MIWLEHLGQVERTPSQLASQEKAEDWIHKRLKRLHARFKTAQSEASDPQRQHQARILAKQLRYAAEDFAEFSPRKYRRWHEQALESQSSIGLRRDWEMAIMIAEHHGAHQVAAMLREIAMHKTPADLSREHH